MLLEALLDDGQHFLVDETADRVLDHALVVGEQSAQIVQIEGIQHRAMIRGIGGGPQFRYSLTMTATFPTVRPVSTWRCASASRSSGKRCRTSGRSAPASTSFAMVASIWPGRPGSISCPVGIPMNS